MTSVDSVYDEAVGGMESGVLIHMRSGTVIFAETIHDCQTLPGFIHATGSETRPKKIVCGGHEIARPVFVNEYLGMDINKDAIERIEMAEIPRSLAR